MSMRFFLATGNRHKLEEVGAILSTVRPDIRVESADVLGGMPTVDESGASFLDNARIKAHALEHRSLEGGSVLADDSGLCVDFLGGEPGVYSSRYAGLGASDEVNTRLLLDRLRGVPTEQRTAHFRCVIVLLEPGGGERVFDGRCHGRIAIEPSGKGGFGYDPVFVPSGHEISFAQLPASEKNRISHRAVALKSLGEWVRGRSVSWDPDWESHR
jgi:XTP/dITP diphosphohydrolase